MHEINLAVEAFKVQFVDINVQFDNILIPHAIKNEILTSSKITGQ
jgi:hypothetical protein